MKIKTNAELIEQAKLFIGKSIPLYISPSRQGQKEYTFTEYKIGKLILNDEEVSTWVVGKLVAPDGETIIKPISDVIRFFEKHNSKKGK